MLFMIASLIIGSYLIYSMILKPYMVLKFYKKQGVLTTFVPIVGPLLRVRRDIEQHHDAHYTIKQTIKKNPDLKAYAQNLGTLPYLVLVDPDLVQEFLQKQNQGSYAKSNSLFYLIKQGSKNGLVFSEGQQWKRHRKILSQSFHYEFLKKMIPHLKGISETLIRKQVQKQCKNVEILDMFKQLTGEIVGKLFFGDQFGQAEIDGMPMSNYISNQLNETLATSFSITSFIFGLKFASKGILPMHKKIKTQRTKIINAATDIIEKKFEEIKKSKKEGRKQSDSKTLIEVFYDLQQSEGDKKDNYFSIEEIIGEFLTFYAAGSDTTAHLLTMSTYYYLMHPEFHQQIHDEIDKFIPDFDNVDIDNLNKMDFMTAFQKETLRLFGPAAVIFHREAVKDHRIGNFDVKKGTMVNINMLASNYNPKYHEDPDKFNPNRWLDLSSRTMASVTKNQYTYVPFSGGPRNCIGQHLAMYEGKIIFSLFIKKFKYAFSDPNYKLYMSQKFTIEAEVPITYDIEVK